MATEISLGSPSMDFPKYNRDTYLQRCTDALDESNYIAKSDERSALAYKVGAYALATFFVVAAAAAVVLTSIYLPVAIPTTAISIVMLTHTVVRSVRWASTRADCHTITAQRTRAIAAELHQLRKKENLFKTQKHIFELVPSLNGCPARCIPLLAHFNYWEKQRADYENQVSTKSAEAVSNIERRDELCVELSKLRQKALRAKTTQAFILAVMQKPDFEGNPEELCWLRDFSIPASFTNRTVTTSMDHPWTQKAIIEECGKSVSAVVFYNKKIAPITFNQLQRLSTQELATRYLQAMS